MEQETDLQHARIQAKIAARPYKDIHRTPPRPLMAELARIKQWCKDAPLEARAYREEYLKTFMDELGLS